MTRLLFDRLQFRQFVLVTSLFFCLFIAYKDFSLTLPSNKRDLREDFNPHTEWCPNATCPVSPLCSPCDRRFLLILATGRSGSTSLTQMINMIPGVRMAGENNHEMYHANEVLMNLRDARLAILPQKRQVGAWMHEPIPEGAWTCPLQHVFETINPPQPSILADKTMYEHNKKHEIIGFKTIRFHQRFNQRHWTQSQAVDFLREVFPCAKILVNIRSSTYAQARSRKIAFPFQFETDLDAIKQSLDVENQVLKSIAEELGDQAYLLDMSEWTNPKGGIEKINQAVEWLGFKNCVFEELIHSSGNGGFYVDNRWLHLSPECRYPDA